MAKVRECFWCQAELEVGDYAAIFDDGDVACVGECADRSAWEKVGVTVDYIEDDDDDDE